MKTAIIGGGINGLYLGWKLSEKNHQVTIFEKKSRIGQEVCSGLFSERILEFIPQSKNLVQRTEKFTFLHFSKKTVHLEFSKPFFIMSHFELDKLVASLAEKAGTKIILNYNISELPGGFDNIIGCDGPNSFVRKELGLPDPYFRLGIQGFAEKTSSDNSIESWACPGGFIWKIPHQNKLEYGIISEPEKAKNIFDDFLKENKIFLVDLKSKLIPQGLIISSNNSITLCGDAAGLTKPWSGGGVIWGLKAADVLLKNFPDFLAYKKEVKRFFFPKIILSKLATKLVYFLGFNFPFLLPKSTEIESDFLL